MTQGQALTQPATGQTCTAARPAGGQRTRVRARPVCTEPPGNARLEESPPAELPHVDSSPSHMFRIVDEKGFYTQNLTGRSDQKSLAGQVTVGSRARPASFSGRCVCLGPALRLFLGLWVSTPLPGLLHAAPPSRSPRGLGWPAVRTALLAPLPVPSLTPS